MTRLPPARGWGHPDVATRPPAHHHRDSMPFPVCQAGPRRRVPSL